MSAILRPRIAVTTQKINMVSSEDIAAYTTMKGVIANITKATSKSFINSNLFSPYLLIISQY
jgi:hypothetical protein